MKKRFFILNILFLLLFSLNTVVKAETNQKEQKINRGKVLFYNNCIVCHKKDLKKETEKIAIPLTQASSKYNFSWLVNWLTKPESYMNQSRMPSYNLNKNDAIAISTFLLATSSDSYGSHKNIKPDSNLLKMGKELYYSKGCNYCHSTKINNELGGPELKKIGSKTNPTWLFNWIKEPRTYFYKTTMVPNNLNEKELLALTSWLDSLKWNKMPIYKFNPKDTKIIDKGRELTKFYRCSRCHNISDLNEEKPLNATQVLKTKDKKVLEQIIKNGIKGTAMPSWKYTFSEEDLDSIVFYLSSL